MSPVRFLVAPPRETQSPPSETHGAIAQLVEQRTENPCVPGSIPGGTTIKAVVLTDNCFFLYVFCFEEVTTELQIPIRPIMRMCRLKFQVRGVLFL